MRMPSRGIYSVRRILREIFLWPVIHLRVQRLVRAKPTATSGALRIVDVNWDPTDDEGFTQAVLNALDLIQRHDPNRRRRIEREIRFIVNAELVSWGMYGRTGRVCSIDYGRFPLDRANEHYQWYLARFACLLIHESTHGYLYSRRVPYTRRTRSRVERICHREERRFAARLPTDRYNFGRDLVPEFDLSRWESHWSSSLLTRIKILSRRIEESERRAGQRGRSDEGVPA
ncbi:MAG: hypothetical protein KY467_09380 [Gemmatimonadetes bacterium]|nr:hypothetical protein [Gemmatimonadota bacterium]